MSLLHHHLTLHLAAPAAGLRPSILHLQFDNCSCENKNKYMLAYCHWLVYNKVFRSITISFLPVGHTHEDIDQMFSTFVIGMKYNPQVLTVEAFIQGLQDWYSAPHLRPEPIFLLECWSIKSWMDPYIHGVQGTSRPHVFRFTSYEADVQMYTKDYNSSNSPWLGPYSFLNICPTDTPIPLVPAQLDTTILKDTLSALAELNNADALKKSYQDLIALFNRPPLDRLCTDPFKWVYQCRHAHSGLITELEPLNRPINAAINLTGSATLELTAAKPDDGAIVAIAGERGAVWLGLVERTTCAHIFLQWLDEQADASYHQTDDPPTSVSYNSLMCADVALDLANRMRPALCSRLLSMRRDWPNPDKDIGRSSPAQLEEQEPAL